MLLLGGLALLSKMLTSALGSCASWSKGFWHADSNAEINSTLGELTGARAKFGPFDKRDTWAGEIGWLDRLSTHLELLEFPLFDLVLLWN